MQAGVSSSIGLVLGAMALISLCEAFAPLHLRGREGRAHLVPNLALTALTLALNAALVIPLEWLGRAGGGLLPALPLSAIERTGLAVVALDLAFYSSHVALHRIPWLWRFHAVHHSDAMVDVSTTLRMHPAESLWRTAFALPVALGLGIDPASFAAYRLLSALCGLLEHANLRVPHRLDRVLSSVTTWPSLHKIHHSREIAWTDSNYGNLLSFWDRLFGSFTPLQPGMRVRYGLSGFEDAGAQTLVGLPAALIALPFRKTRSSLREASSPTSV